MFKKKNSGIDYGSTIPYKCTVCGQFGYNLKVQSKSNTGDAVINLMLKVWGKNKAFCFLECTNCKLTIDIPESEEKELIFLNSKAKDLQEGKISDKDFIHVLLNSSSTVVKEIYERSHSWVCQGCQNEVPATFEVCWNCGTECHEPENLVKPTGEVKVNTSSIFGSGYNFDSEKKNQPTSLPDKGQ